MKGAKGVAVMILRKEKAGGEDDSPDSADNDLSMPSMREVAQELIDAVMDHDAKGVAKALRAAYACASDEPDEDD